MTTLLLVATAFSICWR